MRKIVVEPRRNWLLLGLLVAWPFASGLAQATRVRTSCDSCRIEVYDTYHGGFPASTLGPWPTAIATDSRGRLIVASPSGVISVDRSRKEVRQLPAGESGARQGVSDAAHVAIMDGDSVAVYDQAQRKLTIFDPQLRFVRSAPMPASVFGVVWLSSRKAFLVNAFVPDRSRIGIPFHLFDRVGNQLGSMGSERPISGASLPALAMKVVELPDRTFISVPLVGDVVLERWTIAGQLVERFARPTNFPMAEFNPTGMLTTNPFPIQTAGAWTDPDGMLWVLLWVPDGRWRDGIRQTTSEDGEDHFELIDYVKTFDSVLEVTDLRLRRLVASARFDDALVAAARGGALYSVRRDEAGRFALVQQGARLVNARR